MITLIKTIFRYTVYVSIPLLTTMAIGGWRVYTASLALFFIMLFIPHFFIPIGICFVLGINVNGIELSQYIVNQFDHGY